MVSRFLLAAQPAAAHQARERVRALLASWPNQAARDNATVVVSEVVTNAVRYGGGSAVMVTLTLSPAHLLVDVHDDSPDPPVRRAPGEPGGWGLGLIDELADRWGVHQNSRDGKSVWFEIDAPGNPT